MLQHPTVWKPFDSSSKSVLTIEQFQLDETWHWLRQAASGQALDTLFGSFPICRQEDGVIIKKSHYFATGFLNLERELLQKPPGPRLPEHEISPQSAGTLQDEVLKMGRAHVVH